MRLELSGQAEIRWLLLCGVAGATLYLVGDFSFYAQWSDGGSFQALPAMASRGDLRLALGGSVGPVASALYILGTLGLYFWLRSATPRLAGVFALGWTFLFLDGIAYHAVFATQGFAARLADPVARSAVLAGIRRLLGVLYGMELVGASVGTFALAAASLLQEKSFPRWIVLLMPTVWAVLDFVPRQFPAPLGGMLVGGWINGWFGVFFLVAALIRSWTTRRAQHFIPSAARS
jgi:sterol desaturase/sphingolipid hydroxylase (fatty acid hydroxylase superfamily)